MTLPGDFWGKKYDGNSKGVSTVIINSSKGQSVIKNVSKNIYIKNENFDEIISSQSYGNSYKYDDKERQEIIQLLKNNNMDDAYHYFTNTFSFKNKMIRKCKNFIRLLPISIQFFLRKINSL